VLALVAVRPGRELGGSLARKSPEDGSHVARLQFGGGVEETEVQGWWLMLKSWVVVSEDLGTRKLDGVR